jgi:hypothetical protein
MLGCRDCSQDQLMRITSHPQCTVVPVHANEKMDVQTEQDRGAINQTG